MYTLNSNGLCLTPNCNKYTARPGNCFNEQVTKNTSHGHGVCLFTVLMIQTLY